MGTILFALGRVDAAVESFKQALVLDPDAAWANNNICYAAFSVGDEVAATQHCSAALVSEPGLSVAHNNLGLIHAAGGRVEEAAREFNRSGPALGHYNLGIVLLAMRDYSGALAAFEAALKENPSFDAAFIRAQSARAMIARPRGSR
jgi:tetratricopeptide (TPR) repeat protein